MHALRVFVVAAFTTAALASAMGCEDPAKDKPKATVGSAAPEGEKAAKTDKAAPAKEAPPPAGALGLAPGSTVGFVGSKVTGKHEGTFGVTGYISLADGKAEGGKVKVDIDLGTVKTDQDKLDGHLKSPDFFDVQKFPKAVFESTEVKKGGENGATETITGTLDLHGVKKTITFPATIKVGEDEVTATSEFSINRKDFGIVYAGKADDLIRDDVVIKLAIKAPRKKG